MLRKMLVLLKNNSPIYASKYTFHYIKEKFVTAKDYKVPQDLKGKEILLNCKDIFLTVKGGEIERFIDKEQITTSAERILRHEVDILGYRAVDIGQPIDWHKDFLQNVVWMENISYRKNPAVIEGEGDPKVPQTLSRSHHLVTLGQAYLLTGDNRYVEEFQAQVTDWIKQNPVASGINWQSTMDVAIRAVNWIIAAYCFLDCKGIPEAFWDAFIVSLYQHMIFIRTHMEYRLINGNHLVANTAGLVFLGLLFEKNAYGKRTFRFALRTLIREMHNQVYKDGTDHEGAVYYHYFVAQIFLYTTIYLTRSGQRLPEWYLGRLMKMLDFIAAYIKPNGQAPHVGDSDDGRFIKYLENAPTDHRHLLALAAVFFNRPDFKEQAQGQIADVVWVYGREGVLKYDTLKDIAKVAEKSNAQSSAIDGKQVQDSGNAQSSVTDSKRVPEKLVSQGTGDSAASLSNHFGGDIAENPAEELGEDAIERLTENTTSKFSEESAEEIVEKALARSAQNRIDASEAQASELVAASRESAIARASNRGIDSADVNDGQMLSRVFANSGYFIFKDSAVHLFIKAGEIGLRGRGVHSHCDQLSFELSVNGHDIFVDPGTCNYSGDHELRNLFRATSSHNTVMIDKFEQNRFEPANIFAMENDTQTEVLRCELGNFEDRLEARHYGYWETLGIVHNREFVLWKPERTLTIVDTFDGAGEHLVEWFFHLSRDCEKLRLAQGSATVTYAGGEVTLEYDPTLECEIIDGFISPAYGQMVSGKILRLFTQVDLSEMNQFQHLLRY